LPASSCSRQFTVPVNFLLVLRSTPKPPHRRGASKQLRVLAAAGLLTTKREGYYVVYSFEPEKLATLSDELRSLVGRG
jgi:hypothetical protein